MPSSRVATAGDPDAHALMDGVVRLSFDVMAQLTQVGAQHDVSLTHLRLLAILRDHEPRMTELAAHLGLDPSTVSGLVDRAVGRGHVERFTDPDDRRAARVRLTRGGRRLALRGAEELLPRITGLTAALEPHERDALRALLEKINPPARQPRRS